MRSVHPSPSLSHSAVALCAAASLIPLLVWARLPTLGPHDVAAVLWLAALVPAFVLTYHLGWRGAVLALVIGGALLGAGAALLSYRGIPLPDWRVATSMIVVFVGVTLGVGALCDLLRRQVGLEGRATLKDPLTGLPDRRQMRVVLQVAFDAARNGLPLSIALLDLDRLEWLNEEHGHTAGDRVLQTLASILRREVDDGGAVGRWKGGTFLLVFPGVDVDEALDRLHRARTALGSADLPWRPLTTSGGVAAWDPDLDDADALVARALDALAGAKAAGRDRLEALGPEVDAHPTPVDPGAAALTVAQPEATADSDTVGARIVVIDDEPANLRSFGRSLAALGFQEVHTFSDARAALDHIEAEGVDLVLLDLHMEPLDGFDVLDRLRPRLDREGFLPVVILTGERDPRTRERALRMGGRDFLHKPVDLTELHARILNLLEARALHRQVREAALRLEDRVQERTRELLEARAEILARLARAAEYRDDATGHHQLRVGVLAARLAEHMRLDPERVAILRQAAPLHDIGKIGIPDSILRKPGMLTPEEYALMKQHTRIGAELLADSGNRILETARIIAASHHEQWDGSGYPAGLAGEAIPIEGRIVAVADAFDSLTHRRAYKAAVSLHETMGRLIRDSGIAFDPAVTAALEHLYRAGELEPTAGEHTPPESAVSSSPRPASTDRDPESHPGRSD